MSDPFTTSRGSLETRLFSPSDGAVNNGPIKLAVFTHPWSPLGGNMHDPVLQALRPLFLSRGFHLLIYNARPSLTGVSEAQDLQELVKGSLDKLGNLVDRVVLLGYSHGSLITSMHPLLSPAVKTIHILLSYPMSVRGLITFFHGTTYDSALQDLIQNPESSVLVIYGDRDQFTSLQKYEQWVTQLRSKGKGQLSTVKINGGDHFWQQKTNREELCNCVGHWLDRF